jgi:uncharacterized protein YndB with AHSA1/START domain
VPTARRSRTIAAPVQDLWEVICDPHHLPRWWPRVQRVEDVDGDAFTEVMSTAKGKVVRADFRMVLLEEPARRLKWEQTVEGTPFAHVLKAAATEVRLAPIEPSSSPPRGARGQEGPTGEHAAAPATEVVIELHQTLNGFFPRFGGFMVHRAANATLEGALDGLEQISG